MVVACQIVEEAPTFSDHGQKTTSSVVVLLMYLEMTLELADALSQYRHLDVC